MDVSVKKVKKLAKGDEAIIQEALKRFKMASDAESDCRDLALDDVDFRNGDQWEEKDKQQRMEEGRPCLTINKLEQRVDQVTGDQRMNRMGAVIRPLDSTSSYSTMKLADVMSGIIKNIEATSNAKAAYDTAFDHAVGHGFGYWRIITEYNSDDSFDQDIKIKRINNAFRVYLDPSAEDVTKIDAKWGFITSMVDKDEYPDSNWEFSKGDEEALWHDGEQVRIAEYFRLVPEKQILWLVDGKVIKVKDTSMDIRDELTEMGVEPTKKRTVDGYKCEWYKLSANEIFEKGDFPSKYIPIIPCYGKVLNVRGKDIYRGVIRYAKDPQRIYNYTRTASIEQVALAPKAPWVIEEGQLGDHKNMWETANTKNYSVLLYKNKPGVAPPQRQAPPQPSSGWISEASIADQDIDAASGMYKASLGAPSNERSGKAINARKVEGDVGTYHFHDNRAMSLQHSYTVLVDMIPRVYDTNRIVRIKKFDDKEEMIEINKLVRDDESGKIVKAYDLSMGKYDISVDIGASYTTQRQMASESMMELIQYAPMVAERVMPIIAKNLDWPGAEEIAEVLKAPPAPSQEQLGLMQQQAYMKGKQEISEQTKKFDAMTKRIKAISDIYTDDDKVEIELLKLLDANGIDDEVIRNRAFEIVSQMKEQQSGIEQMQQPVQQAVQQPAPQGAQPQE